MVSISPFLEQLDFIGTFLFVAPLYSTNDDLYNITNENVLRKQIVAINASATELVEIFEPGSNSTIFMVIGIHSHQHNVSLCEYDDPHSFLFTGSHFGTVFTFNTGNSSMICLHNPNLSNINVLLVINIYKNYGKTRNLYYNLHLSKFSKLLFQIQHQFLGVVTLSFHWKCHHLSAYKQQTVC